MKKIYIGFPVFVLTQFDYAGFEAVAKMRAAEEKAKEDSGKLPEAAEDQEASGRE